MTNYCVHKLNFDFKPRRKYITKARPAKHCMKEFCPLMVDPILSFDKVKKECKYRY